MSYQLKTCENDWLLDYPEEVPHSKPYLEYYKGLERDVVKRFQGYGQFEPFCKYVVTILPKLQEKDLLIEVDQLRIDELPLMFLDLYNEIEKSKYILSLPDNWDEDGSEKYEFETWVNAVKFVCSYAKEIFNITNRIISTPKIYHGEGGSIDILWNYQAFRLLINIPNGGIIASFYGDDRNKNMVSGSFRVNDVNRGIYFSLLNII